MGSFAGSRRGSRPFVALHAPVQATNDLRPALRSETAALRPRLAEKRSRDAQGTCKSFVSGHAIQGPSPTVPGKVCAQADTQAGGIELELSFTCEPLPCGLIFHGPAQKLLRFTELLAWPQHRLRPGSLSPLGGKKHEQAFCNVVTTVSPLARGQMTLAGSQCPRSSKARLNKPFTACRGQS